MAIVRTPIAWRQLLTRLIDDHERMYTHHADLCDLCKDAKVAMESLNATPIAGLGDDDSLLSLVSLCADRALVHRPSDEAPFFFTALLGEVLCHDGIDIGPRLIDLVDAATLRPCAPAVGVLDQIERAVGMAREKPIEHRAAYFTGCIEEIVRSAGRPEVADAIDAMFNGDAHRDTGAPQ